MNEYEKLINYLNSVINNIINKRDSIEEINRKQASIKLFLANVLELINNKRINEINIEELSDVLTGIISEDKINFIKHKLIELLSVESFLYDSRISNPIKQIMLRDLDNIKFELSHIISNISELSLSAEDTEQLTLCQKYLDIVNESGYTKILSAEERRAFYDFLRTSNLEETLLLISNYITYANQNKRELEINTSSTAIEIVNRNAEKVLRGLEDNLRTEDENEPVSVIEPIETAPEQIDDEFKAAYEKIIALLNTHQASINPSTYNIYKNQFLDMDINEIYSRINSFLTNDGVNWEMAIPCLKEKLIPNINTFNHSLILKIFNEIISSNQKALEKHQQEQLEEETYKDQLEAFKKDFVAVVKEYDELKPKLTIAISQINERIRNNNISLNLLLEAIKTSSHDDDGIEEYLKHCGTCYDDIKLCELNANIQSNLKDIKEFIELEMLSPEDYKDINDLLNKTKEIIKECCKYYDKYQEKESETEEITSTSKKQYEFGNTVILFFRRDENSKFLVEEDIDKQLVNQESYNDIYQILKRTSEITHDSWGKVLCDPTNFKSFINYNKPNGDKGDVVTVKSDFSQVEYEFFRLKYKGKTIPRLSAFDINMCDENRKKLKIPKDKNIVLFIGEKQVTKHSNESVEYADVIRELKSYSTLIKKYIELFENPETNEETLYKILNDSSDLYNYFKEKAKGMGE